MQCQADIKNLSNNLLIENLEKLSVTENQATVELLLHLAELESRKLYLVEGYSSLFSYLTKSKLKYAESAAVRRISAAKAVAKFPSLVDLLLTKDLSLTTLSLVSKILTDSNFQDVIAAVKGRSRTEVELYLSRFTPKAAVAEKIRPITLVPKEIPQSVGLFTYAEGKESKAQVADFTAAGGGKVTGEPARSTLPLGNSAKPQADETRYELRFAVKSAVMKQVDEAKVLLSGKYPRGVKLEDVLEEALNLFLEIRSAKRREARRAKRKAAACAKKATQSNEITLKPNSSGSQVAKHPPSEEGEIRASRHVPQEVKDKVYVRDEERCGYVSPAGVRCDSRHDLEVHHVTPFGKGGANPLENLALRCRQHNLHAAFSDYGESFMQTKLAQAIQSKLTDSQGG